EVDLRRTPNILVLVKITLRAWNLGGCALALRNGGKIRHLERRRRLSLVFEVDLRLAIVDEAEQVGDSAGNCRAGTLRRIRRRRRTRNPYIGSVTEQLLRTNLAADRGCQASGNALVQYQTQPPRGKIDVLWAEGAAIHIRNVPGSSPRIDNPFACIQLAAGKLVAESGRLRRRSSATRLCCLWWRCECD